MDNKSQLRIHDLIAFLFIFAIASVSNHELGKLLSTSAGLAFFVSSFVDFLASKSKLKFNLIWFCYFLTVFTLTFPIFVGKISSIESAQGYIITGIQIGVMLLLLSAYLNSKYRVRLVINAMALGYLFSILIGHVILGISDEGRAAGLYLNANALGLYSFYVLLLLRTAGWLNPSKIEKFLYFSTAGVALSFAVASQSRKIILLLGIMIVINFWSVFWKSRFKAILALVLVLVSVSSYNYAINELDIPVVKRIQSAIQTLKGSESAAEDQSVLARLDFYRTAWKMLGENPVIGQGPGSFRDNYYFSSNKAHRRYTSHSTYMDMLVSGGLLAFTVFMFGNFALLSTRFKNFFSSFPHRFMFFSFYCMLTAGFFLTFFYDKMHWVTIIVLFSVQSRVIYEVTISSLAQNNVNPE
jgi:O-antigen ligase